MDDETVPKSGAGLCSLPPYTLDKALVSEIERQMKALALELGVVGLMNAQFAVKDKTVYVLEVNPRGSRTVPFVSKAIGAPLAKLEAALLQQIAGVKDIKVEQISGQPYLTIDIDRQKIARFGINVADVQEIIAIAIGGKPATQVYEGERRFQLILRFPEPYRNSVASVGEIRVKAASGALIPMSDLATIEMREGPLRISREHVKRRIFVGFDVVGRVREALPGLERGAATGSPPTSTGTPPPNVTMRGRTITPSRTVSPLRVIISFTASVGMHENCAQVNALSWATPIETRNARGLRRKASKLPPGSHTATTI